MRWGVGDRSARQWRGKRDQERMTASMGACAVEQQRGREDEMSAMDARAVGLIAAQTQSHRRSIRASHETNNRARRS